MSYIIKNPCLDELTTKTELLSDFERIVQSEHGSSSVSYNSETNMYEYSPNIGSETVVSIYSTADVLKYHFGDNLDSVMESGDVYILSKSSGYDIIVYKGQLLGYGATQGIAESTFKEECSSLLKDLVREYVGQYIEENKGMGLNLAYTFSETGINIYSTIDNTNNESAYDVSEFPELFIGFSKFSPSMILGIASEKVLTDYVSQGLSLTYENELGLIEASLLDYGSCTIDPDWYIKLITGYDEYYEKHGTGGLQYNGEEVVIKFDESAWHDIVKEQVESEIDKAIEESNKSTGYNKIDRLNYLHTIAFINYLKKKFSKDEYVDDATSDAGAFSDDEILDFVENTSEIDTKKIIKKFVADSKSKTGNASTKRADPFILDLDGDGFNVETKENGVNFDLDKNGFAEKINWTKKDGFLCLDLNGNGSIDNGGELFGDKTLLTNGTEAANGFEALAQYDSNSDGVIDANDEIYSNLRVWVDGDGDGISAGGELKTLADLGITSINLAYENVNAETGTEATIGNSATFTYADGTVGNAGELWVSSDLFDTVDKVDIEIPDDIKELANVGSIGNVYSLHNAMALDETGELKALVESFAAEQDMDKRMELTEQILFFITGANEVENGSRGSFMNAKKLAVIEAMLGEDYVGTTGKNPNSAAAPLLKEAYADLLDMYYNELAAQTYIKDYVQLLRYTENEDGTKTLNDDLLNYVLEYQLANGDENAKGILADVARYVQYLDNGGIKGMSAFVTNYAAISAEYAAIIGGLISNCEFADGVNPFEGSSSAELILGTDNEDTIYGYSGNDIFIGGKGDDYLNGAAGNDTYIFNIGDGNDVIEDYQVNTSYSRKDKIVFGEGVSAENLIVERNGDNLVLKYGEGDSVTVTEHFKERASNIEFIEFADGVTWNIDDIIDKSNDIYGTADDDKLYGYSSNSSYDYNELFSAGDGNDEIYGYSGNDIFIGGKGNDYLNGAAGNDTYIFNIGDGNDVIEDYQVNTSYSRKDKIVFGEGVSAENLIVERNGDNLVLKYGEGDSVTVTEHFKATASNIEFIEFADGVTWNIDDIIDKANDIYGTADDDKLYGYSSNSSYDYNELFSAGDGNDEIYGYSGNDIFIGGKGNDYLNGAAGNDTYIFNIGDGNDVIEDYQVNTSYSRKDKIVFGEGVSAENLIVERNGDDLVLKYGEGDSVTVTEHFKATASNIEFIEFADGVTWNIDDIIDKANDIYGTADDDKLYGYSSNSSYDYNELFSAGDGNDEIYGYSGNDTLIGGKGNDYLNGAAGNDTYIFNIGDGNDVIEDYQVNTSYGRDDKLIFGDGISIDDVVFSKSGNDLLITFTETYDSMTITNYNRGKAYQIENFATSDGYTIDYSKVNQLIQAMASFEADTGMSWTEAVEQGNETATGIVSEMWVKTVS